MPPKKKGKGKGGKKKTTDPTAAAAKRAAKAARQAKGDDDEEIDFEAIQRQNAIEREILLEKLQAEQAETLRKERQQKKEKAVNKTHQKLIEAIIRHNANEAGAYFKKHFTKGDLQRHFQMKFGFGAGADLVDKMKELQIDLEYKKIGRAYPGDDHIPFGGITNGIEIIEPEGGDFGLYDEEEQNDYREVMNYLNWRFSLGYQLGSLHPNDADFKRGLTPGDSELKAMSYVEMWNDSKITMGDDEATQERKREDRAELIRKNIAASNVWSWDYPMGQSAFKHYALPTEYSPLQKSQAYWGTSRAYLYNEEHNDVLDGDRLNFIQQNLQSSYFLKKHSNPNAGLLAAFGGGDPTPEGHDFFHYNNIHSHLGGNTYAFLSGDVIASRENIDLYTDDLMPKVAPFKTKRLQDIELQDPTNLNHKFRPDLPPSESSYEKRGTMRLADGWTMENWSEEQRKELQSYFTQLYKEQYSDLGISPENLAELMSDFEPAAYTDLTAQAEIGFAKAQIEEGVRTSADPVLKEMEDRLKVLITEGPEALKNRFTEIQKDSSKNARREKRRIRDIQKKLKLKQSREETRAESQERRRKEGIANEMRGLDPTKWQEVLTDLTSAGQGGGAAEGGQENKDNALRISTLTNLIESQKELLEQNRIAREMAERYPPEKSRVEKEEQQAAGVGEYLDKMTPIQRAKVEKELAKFRDYRHLSRENTPERKKEDKNRFNGFLRKLANPRFSQEERDAVRDMLILNFTSSPDVRFKDEPPRGDITEDYSLLGATERKPADKVKAEVDRPAMRVGDRFDKLGRFYQNLAKVRFREKPQGTIADYLQNARKQQMPKELRAGMLARASKDISEVDKTERRPPAEYITDKRTERAVGAIQEYEAAETAGGGASANVGGSVAVGGGTIAGGGAAAIGTTDFSQARRQKLKTTFKRDWAAEGTTLKTINFGDIRAKGQDAFKPYMVMGELGKKDPAMSDTEFYQQEQQNWLRTLENVDNMNKEFASYSADGVYPTNEGSRNYPFLMDGKTYKDEGTTAQEQFAEDISKFGGKKVFQIMTTHRGQMVQFDNNNLVERNNAVGSIANLSRIDMGDRIVYFAHPLHNREGPMLNQDFSGEKGRAPTGGKVGGKGKLGLTVGDLTHPLSGITSLAGENPNGLFGMTQLSVGRQQDPVIVEMKGREIKGGSVLLKVGKYNPQTEQNELFTQGQVGSVMSSDILGVNKGTAKVKPLGNVRTGEQFDRPLTFAETRAKAKALNRRRQTQYGGLGFGRKYAQVRGDIV